MAQKTNPNVLRAGQFKPWNFKYLEKKVTETPKYAEKNKAVVDFVSKFFWDHGLNVCRCNAHYSENVLTIFVSYFADSTALNLLRAHEEARVESFREWLKTTPAANILAHKTHATNFKKLFDLDKKYKIALLLSGVLGGEYEWFAVRFKKKKYLHKRTVVVKPLLKARTKSKRPKKKSVDASVANT